MFNIIYQLLFASEVSVT